MAYLTYNYWTMTRNNDGNGILDVNEVNKYHRIQATEILIVMG
jgi:hypothetical protein